MDVLLNIDDPAVHTFILMIVFYAEVKHSLLFNYSIAVIYYILLSYITSTIN